MVHMSVGLKSCDSDTTDQVVASHRSRSQQFTVYWFRTDHQMLSQIDHIDEQLQLLQLV